MREFLKRKFIDIFLKLTEEKNSVDSLSKEQEIGLFSQLHENPTFQMYLNAREDYLIREGMEKFLIGKMGSAHGFAGQLLEIRNLRSRVRGAWIVINKKRQREMSLTKAQGKS